MTTPACYQPLPPGVKHPHTRRTLPCAVVDVPASPLGDTDRVPTFPTHPLRAVLLPMMVLAACGGSNPTPAGDAGTPGACVGGGGGTVVGQVIDAYGQPISGLTVVQAGRSITADANGCVTFTNVTFPYDIAVVRTTSSPKSATVYIQLTRSDPKLRDLSPAGVGTPGRRGTIGGTLAGTFPGAGGATTAISLGTPESSSGTFVTALPWSLGVGWAGATSTTGTLHALQWTADANGTLTGITSHGVRSGVTLTSGTTTNNADVTLTPVTNPAAVTGPIALPSGYTLSSRTAYLTFADGAFFPVSDDLATSTSFALPVPTSIGASVIYTATADDGVSQQSTAQLSGLAPGTSNAVLTLPSPAVLTAPPTGTTGVDVNTPFTWTPVPGGLTILVMTGQGSDPSFYVVSGRAGGHIPDLGALGIGAGRTYDLTLVALGPYASVDAFTATGIFPREGLGFQTLSQGYRFTTK